MSRETRRAETRHISGTARNAFSAQSITRDRRISVVKSGCFVLLFSSSSLCFFASVCFFVSISVSGFRPRGRWCMRRRGGCVHDHLVEGEGEGGMATEIRQGQTSKERGRNPGRTRGKGQRQKRARLWLWFELWLYLPTLLLFAL